jgi:hypothetical protein
MSDGIEKVARPLSIFEGLYIKINNNYLPYNPTKDYDINYERTKELYFKNSEGNFVYTGLDRPSNKYNFATSINSENLPNDPDVLVRNNLNSEAEVKIMINSFSKNSPAEINAKNKVDLDSELVARKTRFFGSHYIDSILSD